MDAKSLVPSSPCCYNGSAARALQTFVRYLTSSSRAPLYTAVGMQSSQVRLGVLSHVLERAVQTHTDCPLLCCFTTNINQQACICLSVLQCLGDTVPVAYIGPRTMSGNSNMTEPCRMATASVCSCVSQCLSLPLPVPELTFSTWAYYPPEPSVCCSPEPSMPAFAICRLEH